MINPSNWLKLSVILAVCGFSAALADEGKDESGKGRDRDRYYEKDWKDQKHWEREKDWTGDDWEDNRRDAYFYEHGYTRLEIPPGHYPPPGECRIWYPDRPPGHQPPPGRCSPVPPGAWVIRHPYDRPDYVHVIVYEPRRPGNIYVIGEFEIASGAFVRVILVPQPT